MNFNKAVIVGRLTRDPESRAMPSGQTVASFSIATNRVWVGQDGNKQESTEFHNIVAFGKLADICSRYLNKGRLVLIEGRLQTNSWQDKEGNKRYRTEIIADNMQMGPRAGGFATSEGEQSPESDKQLSSDQEEIPVIEAEEPIKPDKKPKSSKEDKSEVDVKNIPF